MTSPTFFNLEKIDQQLGETYYTPIEVARINDFVIRAIACKGEHHWHDHEHEDEGFLVIKGSIVMQTDQETITLNEGDGYVVPRGVKHCPVAQERAIVLLIEPASLVHTRKEDV